MSLTDLFRVTLPYGFIKNKENGWAPFNREYFPLGFNNTDLKDDIFKNTELLKFSIFTEYERLTDKAIIKIIEDPDKIHIDPENQKIWRFFLHNDLDNPMNDEKCWPAYMKKIKAFSKFQVKQNNRILI